MTAPASERRIAILLLVGLIGVWGLFWPTMKVALADLPILSFRALCAVFGAAALFAIAAARGDRIALPAADRKPIVVAAALNITAWFVLSSVASANLPAGRTALLAYTMPLWAFVFAALVLKERPGPVRCIGLIIGMTGIGVLAEPDLRQLSSGAAGGVIAILVGACANAGGTVYQKRIRWQAPLLTQSAWQLTIGGAPLVALALAFDLSSLRWPSLPGLLATLYVIIFGVVYGYIAWFRVIAVLPASTASMSVLPVPVIGVFVSAYFLGESVGWREILAMLLIVGALATLAAPVKANRATQSG